METINIDMINKIKLLSGGVGNGSFSLLWLMASSSQNADTLNCRFHHHAFFEIHYITQGTIHYDFKGYAVPVRAGQYIVIPSGLVHKVGEHSADFCKLTVAFEVGDRESAFCSIASGRARAFDIDEDAACAISMISKYSHGRQRYAGELISLWLQALVYRVMSSVPSDSRLPRYSESKDPRFLKAKKYIEDNYDVFFTCGEVAAYCRLSTKQLGRLFLKYEGVGLLEFIRQAKLAAAKRMLLSTDKTQEEIGKALGFSSVNYFNKYFSKYEGISPGDFKKQKDKEKRAT